MRRKRFRLSPFSRCTSWFEDFALAVRLRWYRTDKGLIIVVSMFGVAFMVFGALLHSVFTHKDDRPSITCLALNVYYEARGESKAGQYAVAEVTMNRLASRRYPDTLCGVVYQKNWDSIRKRHVGAFSWTERSTLPLPKGPEWKQALEVAEAVYYQRHAPTLSGAMHYHATYVDPSWSAEMKPVAQIGRHIFYK